MTLLLQGWEDCLEKGTRDVMSLENGPPCVHWRLERERETNSRRKKKKEATLSQIMEEGLCYSRSRGCKSFAIYGILSEKRLDKRPIKSLPAKSRPKSSTNPFPSPLPAFSLPRWIGGGDIEQCALETHASSARRVHSCGRSKMRLSPLNHGRVTTGEKRKSTIFGLAFFLLRIVGNELRRNWNRSGIEW